MATDFEALPNKIKKGPHWRVNIRPIVYNSTYFKSPSEALNAVKSAQVQFRGWPYPYVNDQEPIIRTNQYVASGSDWGDIVEYWRLYYSGQFINLFGVREKLDEAWHKKLLKEAIFWFGKKDIEPIGFMSIVNMLYHFTEVFEFASRLYKEDVELRIELYNIKGFCLIAEFPKFWRGYYPATDNIIISRTINKERLLGESSDIAVKALVECLQFFGWDNPPVEILKSDQENFLQRKL